MKAQTKPPLSDIYTRVTDKIIADLEQGVRPWVKPWNGANVGDRITLPARHNNVPYQGINILLLWGEQRDKGFQSNRWMTFKQAQALGANVGKSEHGSLVVYASKLTKSETADNGDEIEREIPFMKGYTVFNVDQIENLPAEYLSDPAPVEREPLKLIEQAEVFFAKTRAVIRHGGNKAYYAPSQDIVQLPIPDVFDTAESYAATKAHEITHWTSHKTRLDRQLGKRFGDDAYAAEELIAEMGAAFVCAQLGLTPEVRDDHAAYLDHWLKVLKADKKAVFTAASQAQKACDFLFSLQGADEQQAA
ncbi:zincin-like metallopeptidase domain-containing protein [Caballeronia sp. LZ028]|uniref:ArdC family protein n=1 Tax=Caballeronia sp. LZ028 TaxID=3038563 RepID=UPI0028604A30|nr:zincin-like metallopeptidase domain-containing protein [Caballeronia sp. LZ028]MDR5769658.1 zincin-like metallopeptidase domain-containing protein [Caballeronia sp. LZ028]